jgi:hypothetical protein
MLVGVHADQLGLQSAASNSNTKLVTPLGDDFVRLGSQLEVPPGCGEIVEKLLLSFGFGFSIQEMFTLASMIVSLRAVPANAGCGSHSIWGRHLCGRRIPRGFPSFELCSAPIAPLANSDGSGEA